jgi:hypothetical protein
MKNLQGALVSILVLLFPAVCTAEIPNQIAGFELGGQITDFQDRIKMETAMSLRYSKNIEEIEIRNVAGFKNGLLWVAKCANPGRIVRIRMKYADSSKKFYEELLQRCRERFGKPSEWRGDPFHIVISWKWSFIDDQNNRISMILEHNIRDEEETPGNTIKLTMWNLIDQESACVKDKEAAIPAAPKSPVSKQADWEALLPR